MFSIADAFRVAWSTFKQLLGPLIGMSVVVWLVPVLPGLLATQMVEEDETSRFALTLVGTVLGILLDIGWRRVLLDVVDGYSVKIGDLLGQTRLLFRYFVASVLNLLFVGLPTVVLVVLFGAYVYGSSLPIAAACTVIGAFPLLYLGTRLSLWTFCMVDRDAGIFESLTASWVLSGPVWLKLLGLYVAIAAIVILSLIPIGLGLLVSMPVVSLAAAHVYRILVPATAEA